MFPEKQKIAISIPIFKKDDPPYLKITNQYLFFLQLYRTRDTYVIQLYSCFNTIMLLCDNQYGFRANIST